MAKKKIMTNESAGDVAVDPIVVDVPVVDAPVVETPAAPPQDNEHVVDGGELFTPSVRFPVRADVTFNDGSVKTFSGESQDSELDLSKIEVNG